MIIAAIDTTEESADILAAAAKVAKDHNDAQVHVVTVIRPINYTYSGFDTAGLAAVGTNFETEARKAAQDSMQALSQTYDIDSERLHVVFGSPASAIKEQANELNADLIVLGSHGRSGLGLLLGSTANGVLHGAPCDVLTIRVGK